MGITGIMGIRPPAHINEVVILFGNNVAELSVYFGQHLRSNNCLFSAAKMAAIFGDDFEELTRCKLGLLSV